MATPQPCPVMRTLPLHLSISVQLGGEWGTGEEHSGKSAHPHARAYTRTFSPRNPESPQSVAGDAAKVSEDSALSGLSPRRCLAVRLRPAQRVGAPLPQRTGPCSERLPVFQGVKDDHDRKRSSPLRAPAGRPCKAGIPPGEAWLPWAGRGGGAHGGSRAAPIMTVTETISDHASFG